jgi:FAD/FMN-containing dehydrogenase/Fe-S oxidoreductase
MSRTELPVLAEPSLAAGGPVDLVELRLALMDSLSGEVRFDRLSRALYSTDASVYQIVPLGVVLPHNELDVIKTLALCAGFRVPLTARGGGTSQAGQAIGAGVVLDCSRSFNEVLEFNAAERWARVRPGCVLDDLNRAVNPLGLHFPHDVSTSDRATLGGMVANNSSGTRSVLYGKTIDHVLEVRVVLSDGTVLDARALSAAELDAKCRQHEREGECYRVVRRLAAEHADEIDRRYPKILRRVGGYNLDRFVPGAAAFNLADLLVGSEGTLAVTLEAKLRLVELPRARALLVIQFADLLEALAATPAILAHGPAAVEVIDRHVLDSTRINPEAARLRDFLQGDPAAILLIEFYGDRPEDLPPRLDRLECDMTQRGFGYHCHRATDPAAQARIWKLRKAALGLSMAQKGDAKALSFVEDTAVAPEHLRDYIAEFLAVVARHGTTAGVYAHASVGCLHVRPVVDLKTEDGIRRFEAIAGEVADLVLKYGGALSGEHGDGLVRSPFQEKMFGPVLYNAFREIKRTFDPLNLLNPGKIVDAPPLAANLRYGPGYVTPQVPTTFDFSADGGIVRAAELCSGVGACRKKHEGVMCPSYQATREEQHSTRGRANTLRLAMTGQVGLQGLTDPAVFAALDLCLECKACKAECPTNVDMARLKAEFLHHYYRKHGLPWRNRLFGNVAKWSDLGERVAGWVRFWGGQSGYDWLRRLIGSRLLRWLNEKAIGIDRRRQLPFPVRYGYGFVNEYCMRFDDHREGDLARTWQSEVLLFPDTFTEFYESAAGLAACAVLSRLNCRVRLGFPRTESAEGWDPVTRLRCCGRPFISNGMLERAVADARHNVARLYDWAAAGKPIVACEPSCILTIKDDYPALLLGEDQRRAETVAVMCRTFEEFADELLSKQEKAPFRGGPRRILVQGHCHQRALVGMGPTLRLLRRIPGAEVIDLDAGCCGMAGSFGYEKEHYEVSRLVGEQRLFPALRHADPDTVVVAPGFSCRRQIEHFTGRRAVHPAELLSELFCEPPAG